MSDQSTSGTTETQPTSDGVVKQLGRQVEDATRKYRGGTENAQLAMGHPDLDERFYGLLDELAKEQALRLPIMERPVWKTVHLGTDLKTKKDFIGAIEKVSGKVSDWSKDIMGKKAFIVADQPTELDLVVVSVAELGFPDGAKFKDIYAKAKTFNLELCPPEVGPQLRLQYMDQPKGEWLIVAMETIAASDGSPSVFHVVPDGLDRWLYTSWASPASRWFGCSRFVFCRRK